MAITIEKIIGSSEGNPDTGLTARNKINSNFQNLVDAILSIQVEAGTTSFNNLTDKPTTLSGYGITDAAGRYHTHTFSVLEGKPTTIEGYGITDAYGKSQIDTFLNGKLNSSVFNDLFEKVNIGTELDPIYAIEAKYGFYSVGGISTLGVEVDVGGGGTGGLDYEALQTLLTGSTNAYEINAAFLTAITSGYITGKLGTTYSLSTHNHDSLYSALAHSHNLSDLTNDEGFITSSALASYATQTYVNTAVNNLINGAPAARDTLKEISDILDANINSIGDITTAISTKWTQDNTKISNWDAAFTNSHTHANKSLLDGITQTLIDKWNSDLLNGHTGSYYTEYSDNSVKNLKIGGVNIIPKSNNVKDIIQKSIGGTFTYDILDKDGGTNATTLTYNAAGEIFRIGQADTNSILKISGDTYTYSCWIYPIVGTQIKMGISAMEPILFNLTANKWQRIYVTTTMVDGAWYDAWRFIDLRCINSGDSFNIYHPKLEVGDKATDWIKHISDDLVIGSTWTQGEDSNGDLIWYKNGVAKAKLTTDGFISMGGSTALG